MRDLLTHLVARTVRVTHAQPFFHFGTQVASKRLPGRHDFFGVLVAQLVQRKIAQRSNTQGFGKQFRRIEAREAQALAQMPLAIGEQHVAGTIDRPIEAKRGQNILQSPPPAHMHVHIATSHQWQPTASRQGAQPG